jgi:hypothetical protein
MPPEAPSRSVALSSGRAFVPSRLPPGSAEKPPIVSGMPAHAFARLAETEAVMALELCDTLRSGLESRHVTDAFLECGIVAHDLLRLRCGECGRDKLLAFSCTRRESCPSCGARRMSQTVARLVDPVIPHVPVPQWLPSPAIPLRLLLASPPPLVTLVLQPVQHVLTRHLLDCAGLKAAEGHGGAATQHVHHTHGVIPAGSVLLRSLRRCHPGVGGERNHRNGQDVIRVGRQLPMPSRYAAIAAQRAHPHS